jgi:hypothetical protein
MNLYWGDMHAQFKPQWQPDGDWEAVLRRAFESARGHLDFFPMVYYPASFYKTPEGLHVETVGMRPEFEPEWDLVKRLCREHNEPGRLVSFPGYEWTGNRTRWGDCNVFFRGEPAPLDLSLDIDDLFANLKALGAIAIPHHTGYEVGDRGKDWDHHDEDVCPFVEVFSVHGSSEGCNTPRSLDRNAQMSPRVSGGTVQDGLARGYRLGLSASGDNGSGFPGQWGLGLLAAYAEELTVDSLWEAFMARRVYGVTGDRIGLRFSVNEGFMGSVVTADGPPCVCVEVDCTQALDRIEILRDNRIVHTHCHNGSWAPPASGRVRAKLPIEFGWGPAGFHGFKTGEHLWQGALLVKGGRIVSIEGCFTTHGQRLNRPSPERCEFTLRTIDRPGGALTATSQQTVVFEIEADVQAPIMLDVDGRRMSFTLGEAMRRSELLVFREECREAVRRQFGIDPDTVENPDVFYHNAYILKRHTTTPEVGYRAVLEWQDPSPLARRSFYYVRVSQLNGQLAWSSPVWVEGRDRC